MIQLVIGGLVAFFTTYYTIPVIIKVAKAKKLYDEPDNIRKLHLKPIPSLGGLGIFIGFMLSLLFTVDFTIVPEFQFYLATFLIIFFVGMKDDIWVLSAIKKLLVQCLVAAIIIYKGGLLLDNMYGFLGLNEINTYVSYFLTFFAIVVITNAFNLIDGVDGLAGSLSLISCIVFGTFFLINGNLPYAVLGLGLAASILAFLAYNFHPAKIFMGDTGSLLLGLVNSILVIKFISTASHYVDYPVSSAPAIGFCILLLPLMDTLRVFGIRIFYGRSPFSADRNHIHHLFMDRGMVNPKKISLTCSALTLIFTLGAFLLQGFGTTLLILLSMSSFFIGVSTLYFNKRRSDIKLDKKERIDLHPIKEDQAVRLNPYFSTMSEAVAEKN